jgi:hypothetical protein
MSEYINLEDKILSLIEFLSEEPINPGQIQELSNTFNQYWGEYQDTWNEEYWEVYNLFRQIGNKQIFNNLNKKLSITENEISFLNDEIEKMQDCKNGEKMIRNPLKNRTRSTLDRSTFNSSFNLNKIDEELDKVYESSIGNNIINEKKRGCLECVIF